MQCFISCLSQADAAGHKPGPGFEHHLWHFAPGLYPIFDFFPPSEGWTAALSKISWASAALGLSIIGLELGFLLAYRAGWAISTAGIVSATAVAMVLVPVSLAAFKERLSPVNGLGIVLCIIGLVLVNFKTGPS